jgi:GT2 family glycosyltransferase
MLMTDPTPNAAAATTAARELPRAPVVHAVLVVRNAARWLPAGLDALAAQTLAPARLVVVDLGSSDGSIDLVDAHAALHASIPSVQVERVGGLLPFGQAVARGVGALDSAGAPEGGAVTDGGGSSVLESEQWLWLLHDDTAAEPETLARLVEAVRRSPSVGIAGPKVVQWDQPRHLVDVGLAITRAGRRLAAPRFGEQDQGQYDARTDVLAVGSSGMLVRRGVWDRLGGFDPAFQGAGEDLDLGWRAQLAGHRVIVVPAARMRDASATYAGDRPGAADPVDVRRAQRRSARRVALTRCPPWQSPFLAVWVILGSLGSALALLLLKRPIHAWAELGDLTAVLHPVQSARARRRFRGARVLSSADLASLFVTPGEAVRHTWDRVQDALTPDRSDAEETGSAPGSVETGPVAEEAEDLTKLSASLPQRVITHAGFIATLAAAVVAGVGWRQLLRSGLLDAQGSGLVGGELGQVTTDAAGLWHTFFDGWHGAGLGTTADAGPAVAVLSAVSWLAERLPYVGQGRSPAAVAMAWVLVLGMPLATATAYLAGRVVTRTRWSRGLVSFAWGTSAVLAAAVSQGRVTVVLAHALLPLVMAGYARVVQRGGTFTSAFATAFATAVLGALVPAYLVVAAVAALLIVVLGPGVATRLRALALLVVPLALQGARLPSLVDLPTLLGGPGLLDAASGSDTPLWQVVLGRPQTGTTWVALLGAPLLLVGVASLLRHGSPARSGAQWALAGLALLGLAAALGAPRVVLGQVTGSDSTLVPATMWSGVGLELFVAGLFAAALAASVGMGGLLGRSRWGARRLGAGVLAVTLLASTGAAAVTVGIERLDSVLRLGQDLVPAVAVDQGSGPSASRLLVLRPQPDRVDYEIVGREPGQVLRTLATDDAVTDPGFGPTVSTLASGLREAGPSSGDHLANLGVGFVSVWANGDSQLIRTLDATPGLTRLGSGDGRTLWRVQSRTSAGSTSEPVLPARVRIVDGTGAPLALVPVSGAHGAADVDIPAGAAGRRLVVAESPDWAGHAQVRFSGAVLTPLPTMEAGEPAYQLPVEGGRLTIDVPSANPRWRLLQLALLAVVVFLSVPFGNRRSRRLA